jgi:hypothetical protein
LRGALGDLGWPWVDFGDLTGSLRGSLVVSGIAGCLRGLQVALAGRGWPWRVAGGHSGLQRATGRGPLGSAGVLGGPDVYDATSLSILV